MSAYLDLQPVGKMSGSVTLPGSKSISNRVLLLAALAEGETLLSGVLDSDDTKVMLDALRSLNVPLIACGVGNWRVTGAAQLPNRNADVFVGNSGLSARTLVAALAFSSGVYRVRGVQRMHERPIGDLVEGLRPLGANIRYEGKEGYPPLLVGTATPGGARRTKVHGDVSSQFLTGLLLAAPLAATDGDVDIEIVGELISRPYVEITLNLMARFGVQVRRDGWQRFTVPHGSRYRSPGTLNVEGDASSASYFLAAGVIAGGPVRVVGVGKESIQGDIKFADALAQMGGEIEWGADWIEARRATSQRLRGLDFDAKDIPDAAMTLAVVALFAEGTTTIRNVASWRVKETDRLAAMATELRKIGATVAEGEDSISVAPPPGSFIPAAEIATYDDHRMAMCFSLISLAGVPVRILDPECVAKTFPRYFDEFNRLVIA